MPKLESLLNYEEIYNKWLKLGADFDSAIKLTKEQVEGFRKIVADDQSWLSLIEIASKGRIEDAWLASDWPVGFDELTLCVPLCKLVDWECAKCTIGKRQGNSSCANDNSVFGYIGVLVAGKDRAGLLEHLDKVSKMLEDFNCTWNTEKLIVIPAKE